MLWRETGSLSTRREENTRENIKIMFASFKRDIPQVFDICKMENKDLHNLQPL